MTQLHIAVVTLFPEMFQAITEFGVSGRGFNQKLIALDLINPRCFTEDKHQTVDDRPYGGGPGMVMMAEPLLQAIEQARCLTDSRSRVVYASPQGAPLTQQKVLELAAEESLIFLCGRYEGVDERLLEATVDEEISLGDFVVSGGELPVMVMIDAIARFIPGVLGNELSKETESHRDGLLDCPHYTRPEHALEQLGCEVPEVLLSGDHAAIRRWRLKMSLGRTWQRRPDLLKSRVLSAEEQYLLSEYQQDLGNS